MERKHLLYFLTTDPFPSPFDINMAYDAGFHAVIPYGNVTEETGTLLVHDIIFSRGPKGAKFSAIFIGGNDVELAEKLREAAVKSMFPPFQVSLMIDPKGAYTTAAALVAKVEKAFGGLQGRKAAILGGTGPVGRIAATLCAKNGCEVIIGSRSRESAERLAKAISEKSGGAVKGAQMGTDEEKIPILKEVDLILATAKAGVQILSQAALEALPPGKLVADVNAVPPTGIAGLDPSDDLKEIAPGIRGIGALAIGILKYDVEMEMLETIRTSERFTVLDDNSAMEIARRRLG
ncbi:MAG: NAD(P)-dependent methylenetetrahydromethanopterin dehydrogenase [Candidatus Methylomirabilales bacterium]